MIEIACCYEFWRGVSRNKAEAEVWYRRASASGSQLAMLKCAKAAASRHEFGRCEGMLQIGADRDWTPAIYWLAWYRHKQSNSSVTYGESLSLLRKAARRGHAAARMILAIFMVRESSAGGVS
jgi:TPR repeat protein